jgi:Phospholipase_D-nuclease N-terminal
MLAADLALVAWFGGLLALAFAVAACVALFRDRRITGGGRVMFLCLVLLFPVLGPIVYFGVRRDW